MQANDVVAMAEELMEKHGLIEQGWTVGLDSYSKQYGVCCEERKYISISMKLASINPEFQTRLTILHEIAHALVGCWHGHDEVWARCCRKIGGDGETYYSCNVQRPKAKTKQSTFYLPYTP